MRAESTHAVTRTSARRGGLYGYYPEFATCLNKTPVMK